MSEMKKCRCGSTNLVTISDEERGLQAICQDCGRRGQAVPPPTDNSTYSEWAAKAVAAWNADRLAEEKAREALTDALGMIEEPGRWDVTAIERHIRDALALLEAR